MSAQRRPWYRPTVARLMAAVAVVAVLCSLALWAAAFPEESARRARLSAAHGVWAMTYREHIEELRHGLAAVTKVPTSSTPFAALESNEALAPSADFYYYAAYTDVDGQSFRSYRDRANKNTDLNEFARLLVEKAEYREAMRDKWNRAARYPWWPVPTDPPDPGRRIESQWVGSQSY